MEFNNEQLKAINHFQGPALVVAGPGSGKTATLVRRIRRLIEYHKVRPESILVITFSRAAAYEMQDRFLELCEEYYPVNLSTFHSFFFSIIHRIYHYDTSNIINTKQQREYLRKVIKDTGVVNNEESMFLDAVLKLISSYKNSGETVFNDDGTHLKKEQFLIIYEKYCELQRLNKKIDFEDMMIIVKNIFIKYPNILEEYQLLYTHVLIDEFQDINTVQYEIVKMLVVKSNNLYVVGDDDQSIYGFRGSKPEIMLNFVKDFPGCVQINMTTNYRCAIPIINAARSLICNNTRRYDKEIIGVNDDGNVTLKSFSCREEEDKFILNLLNSKKSSDELNDVVIMQRTNRENTYYYGLLKKNNIPVRTKEKIDNPFDSIYFKDLMHYLTICNDSRHMNIRELFPVMNRPVRYISRSDIHGDFVSIEKLKEIYRPKQYMKSILTKFEMQLKMLSNLDIYSGIIFIRKGIGYDEYIRDNVTLSKAAFEEYMEKMDLIMELVKEIKNIDELKLFVQNWKNEDKEKIIDEKGVSLMTFHASKGLEFLEVIIPHINEGCIPNSRSVGDIMIEEERRMLYVAMTRAKRELVMTYVSGKKERKALPSRFIKEISRGCITAPTMKRNFS